jgi:hypothetical protein
MQEEMLKNSEDFYQVSLSYARLTRMLDGIRVIRVRAHEPAPVRSVRARRWACRTAW